VPIYDFNPRGSYELIKHMRKFEDTIVRDLNANLFRKDFTMVMN